MVKDNEHTCVFHGENAMKIESVERATRGIPKMNMKINIGYGIFLCGALIVGIVFSNLDSVSGDMRDKQAKHELMIQGDQGRLREQLENLDAKVDDIDINVAVLKAQLRDYQDDLDDDRIDTKESLKELKDLIITHAK
jgi:hypothetical protein